MSHSLFAYVRNKYELDKVQKEILNSIVNAAKNTKPGDLQSVINELNRKVENNFSEEQSSIILKQTSILVNSNDFWHYFNSKIKEASDSTSALNKTCIPPGGTPAGYPPNIEPEQ